MTIAIAVVFAAAVFVVAYAAMTMGVTAWERGQAIVDSK